MSSRIAPHAWIFLAVTFLLVSVPGGAQQVATPQGGSQKVEPREGETLHVLVGKSVVVNVSAPLTRVLSSNPTVIETMATSPTEVVLEGKTPGVSSVILWDNVGHSQVLDVEVDLDVTGLRNAIQRAYPEERLEVEADGGHLILLGTASNSHIIEDLNRMASSYAKDVLNSVTIPLVHDRQVLLEVKFAEVDRTALAQFGVNLLSTGAGNTIGSTTTGQYGSFGQTQINDSFGGGQPHFPFGDQTTVPNPLNIFLFRPDIHLGAIVQDLQQRNVLQILAEPNLMALTGQKATFLAGGEFPFPIVQPGAGLTTVTIQFKPFGVKLDFIGTVSPDNTIRLHVSPEVSTLDFSNALTLSGFLIPAISTRRAETEIELKDGQAFGIAGLLDHRATNQLSKVPGIGDIPILGQLFRSRNINKNNTELLVMVTPHIVDPVHQETTAPASPKPVVPFLDQPKFDREHPGNSEVQENKPGAGVK
jgi:pilus assembly protein CpaC